MTPDDKASGQSDEAVGALVVERTITGFHQDVVGDWVAELDCGHNQHIRHRPPFQIRAWVVDDDDRAAHLGTKLGCPLCERTEAPPTLRRVRATPIWDEQTIPKALRRDHRIAAGTWGLLIVHRGRLRFIASTTPEIDVEVDAGSTQGIPPEISHRIEPSDDVRFSIEFSIVDRGQSDAHTEESPSERVSDEGGDPACWAGLLCADCGVVLGDGPHRPGCTFRVNESET
ncbi:MAG: DUF3565 domain-containing protein [Acidimicrobiales bacterium]